MTEFILNIKDRKISNKVKAADVFHSLKDGKYLLRIIPINKRSLSLNAFYWSIVTPAIKTGLREAGYPEIKTNEDAHEVLKHRFLKKKMISEKDGKEIVISGSTTDLTNKEFNEYLEEIRQWAAEFLNVQVPLPNEIVEPINDEA